MALPEGDARRFNIRDAAGRLLCPACGFPDFASHAAYDERGGIIGRTICPCCLWEPGFDDDMRASADALGTIIASLLAYRMRWGGPCEWRGREGERPADWDGQQQLDRLRELAPHLF